MSLILGSQSTQRAQLLKSVVGDDLEIVPPISDQESGFSGLHDVAEIESRLHEVVGQKLDDVTQQILSRAARSGEIGVICADTVVVARSADDTPIVLGKPPVDDWQECVRSWFVNYYAGTPHEVWTGFQIVAGDQLHQETVKTSITLREIDDVLLSWYLSTEEPIGKAGGYGIQGIAAMFVETIQGSLTNVVGLPMLEVTAALRRMNTLRL